MRFGYRLRLITTFFGSFRFSTHLVDFRRSFALASGNSAIAIFMDQVCGQIQGLDYCNRRNLIVFLGLH